MNYGVTISANFFMLYLRRTDYWRTSWRVCLNIMILYTVIVGSCRRRADLVCCQEVGCGYVGLVCIDSGALMAFSQLLA